MYFFPILLIAILLVADGGVGLRPGDLGLGGWTVTGLALAPVLAVLAFTDAGVRRCQRRLAGSAAPAAVVRADRLARLARHLLLIHFAVMVLLVGWLDTVRGAVGDVVLFDELLALAPPIAGVLGTWWVYYPIERRLRDATLLRRLDLGRSVVPTPGRLRYVLIQARLHLLWLLVPILLILAAAELIDEAVGRWGWSRWIGDAATIGVAAAVVIAAPLLARSVLEVEPLPAGPVRDELLDVCRAHRVRVRNLLVWRTHGSMINAAVMGLFGRLRYVLLTDTLLESMTRPQMEAVMAHEIGHIRRRHMPWLLASLLATIIIVGAPLLAAPLPSLLDAGASAEAPVWLRGAWTVTVGAAAFAVFAVFGWISRRFERQADTFAARHLSRDGDPSDTITAEAVATMSGALELIARLNAVEPDRRSWRHGSITWRRTYLSSIVGRPFLGLPIDRQVRWIKGLSAGVLCVALILSIGVDRGDEFLRGSPWPSAFHSGLKWSHGSVHEDARRRQRLHLPGRRDRAGAR